MEHENPFYQVGKLFTYKLSCELFQFSQEDIDTDYSALIMLKTQDKNLLLTWFLKCWNFTIGETVTTGQILLPCLTGLQAELRVLMFWHTSGCFDHWWNKWCKGTFASNTDTGVPQPQLIHMISLMKCKLKVTRSSTLPIPIPSRR